MKTETQTDGSGRETSHSEAQALAQLESVREMVKALTPPETLSEDEKDNWRENAQGAIEQDALAVQVRSGWVESATLDGMVKPEEFCILLCTGGPAVRIIGELDDGTPTKVRIEHQDWGTPWTELRISAEDEATLLKYASVFYWG